MSGGYGSLTGTLNGFDIETLANRLHNAGSKINDALTVQAKWMPTIFKPASIAAGVDDVMLNLKNASDNFNLGFYLECYQICKLDSVYLADYLSTTTKV